MFKKGSGKSYNSVIATRTEFAIPQTKAALHMDTRPLPSGTSY